VSEAKQWAEVAQTIGAGIQQAVAAGDQAKARLLGDQVRLLCEQLAATDAEPELKLVLQVNEEEAHWDQIVSLARTLDDAVNVCDLSLEIALAFDELMKFGKAKVQTPEVVARIREIRLTACRLNNFIDAARQYIADVENLYGCSLADIQRSSCSQEAAS
jgi:hypothetical protein